MTNIGFDWFSGSNKSANAIMKTTRKLPVINAFKVNHELKSQH